MPIGIAKIRRTAVARGISYKFVLIRYSPNDTQKAPGNKATSRGVA